MTSGFSLVAPCSNASSSTCRNRSCARVVSTRGKMRLGLALRSQHAGLFLHALQLNLCIGECVPSP